jgi:hypothetical protein
MPHIGCTSFVCGWIALFGGDLIASTAEEAGTKEEGEDEEDSHDSNFAP